MRKAEFIDTVAKKSGLKKKDMDKALSAILETITETLAKGDTLNFIGFGSFSTIKRNAREARVPLTGRKVNIPERRVVKFKAGKGLKEAVAKVV
jgi:DNA-binding protein HU-beta